MWFTSVNSCNFPHNYLFPIKEILHHLNSTEVITDKCFQFGKAEVSFSGKGLR